jgi:hypothetical protein
MLKFSEQTTSIGYYCCSAIVEVIFVPLLSWLPKSYSLSPGLFRGVSKLNTKIKIINLQERAKKGKRESIRK